ncbi:aminotransferase class I/II-fold pyridoxal phosphate-dependent enzyme [Rhizobium leguminosarum]|uniref:Aminotransferase class I/II-fold pyridoxal phosphate-dependent enzyme n=1 Tax=Rhizobium ruizarguesonis TaxID=2081791 RepID=A0AAE4YJB2_9HYPH|nr:DegT/DnrJ/EryC1/StrS family aminotransferase [Rhizobium ruizarguesonis]TBY72781.1 DegT/DnrJ/EryC1/StrS family aminotransferase [Rhizobium leguminosarum bv. viciae]MCB2403408.1 DegT/DnrJ/EryC1/StrS family aminotransferase [Rhizobium ruizarguesonis]NEH28008.1 aminotransferase class I/II-fold pyridoxal phosphate-dependent enzyme [Rhizobium ruizarguesonis]NEH77012.1 aminotransferase class I/II-fold pyridoxal phosphate-dependent enzyme [Rhizobium ruizarguesonis]NEI22441.1 aminotransferase class 
MIPFLDLKAQYQSIKSEIDAAVLGVLASGQYILGEEVARLEQEFADYCNVKHAIAVNTGTSALHLSLLAAGVGPGDEVITVPFTFVATVSAICYAGARPVFVDVEPVTLTMDPSQLEAKITPRTKAIIPVHLYGQMADMDAIKAIADHHGIAVIEDACQAHGAQYKGARAGSIGTSGCFSFYPGKNLGACGEGGMVVTNSDDQAKTMRMLRDWGQEQRYHHLLKGFNYRMDAIQGAILRIKLRHLEAWTEARRAHGRRYSLLLGGSANLRTPVEITDRRHVYHVYAIRSRDRDQLQRVLSEEGIQSGLHYPIPVHLQKAHADLGYKAGDFPISEAAAREVLSLPIYPEMPAWHVDQVAAALENTYVS